MTRTINEKNKAEQDEYKNIYVNKKKFYVKEDVLTGKQILNLQALVPVSTIYFLYKVNTVRGLKTISCVRSKMIYNSMRS